jgi:hypothetical protein
MSAHLLVLLLTLSPRLEVEHPDAHRLVATATVALVARTPAEARALSRRARIESNWKPGRVSPCGACGLWQQRPQFARPATTCRALLRQPVHAALVAVATMRRMRAICGDAWEVCYAHGPWSDVALAARAGGTP